jgi:hypothetical protein
VFKRKVARLREHFERFNVDVSDLCQWLMSLRPKDRVGKSGEPAFWDFFLAPNLDGVAADETEPDRWRLAVFDYISGLRPEIELAGRPVPELLRQAMLVVSGRTKTTTTTRLFDRLRSMEPSHRLVLLKAAAEWIVARYQRGLENWTRQHDEWEKEKEAWESEHPRLTEHVRNRFTRVFKELVEEPTGNGPKGVRRKNPRICPYERLRQNKDNCIYAGEKGHGPLCWRYVGFVRHQKERGRFNDEHFWENAERYLTVRRTLEKPDVRRKLRGSPRQEAFNRLYQQKGIERAKGWFTAAWNDYLQAMELREQTVVNEGRLPHCQKIGETWERSQCERNPHTHLCAQYKLALAAMDQETLSLEREYREWRRQYLAGPRKPSFKYPSSRKLPTPKIFGTGYQEIDFETSVLRLRLDGMRQGECIEFGFIPWPKDYRPGRREGDERQH